MLSSGFFMEVIMMQKQIVNEGRLLNSDGTLNEAGYATYLIKTYDRRDIKANAMRIKEWDYYLINDGKRAIAFTISDNSYMGMMSVSWLDFEAVSETTKSEIILFPNGKTKLPPTSVKGDVSFHNGNLKLLFANDGILRHLKCEYKAFRDGKTLKADLILSDVPRDSMVIATPYKEDPKAFYYNQKINCLRAEGIVSLGNETWHFHKQDAFGVLDWGRGVWTYSNTWYWASLSGEQSGHTFGFNLGYGFGDTSQATENMIFVDGIAHKLSHVTFNIPFKEDGNEDFMKPWTFTSDDGRLYMDFVPVIDRAADINLKLIRSNQHQVFGRFTGKVILDDGSTFEIENLPGFAEKVMNKW